MAKKPKQLPVYRSYRFIDKDPVIDRMRTLHADSGLSYQDVHDSEGLSVTTMYNWFKGGTRRPQFCTVMSFYRAHGVNLTETPYKNGRKS